MRRRYWIGLVVAAAAIAAAGGAFAATKLDSPSARNKAVIADAAHRLHVSPGALSSALRHALDDQVNAAVAAGRLSKERGAELKARIDSGRLPLLGPLGLGPRLGLGFPGRAHGLLRAGLAAVTSYLGITPAQLRAGLAAGKTPAQLAREHGKTAAGLVAALVAAARTRLDRGVAAGRLSPREERRILARLETLIGSFVNRRPLFRDEGRAPFFSGPRRPLGPPSGHFPVGPVTGSGT